MLSISFEMGESPILPPEVFRQIFSFVTRDQLSRCARVSKTWCQHATPVLYEDINLTWRRSLIVCKQSWDNMHMDRCVCERTGLCKSEKHQEASGNTRRHRALFVNCLETLPSETESWPSLYHLTRTLVSSPALARLVCRFRLAGPVPHSIWTNSNQTSLSPEDLEYIELVLRCDAQVSIAEWLRRLQHGCPSAFAALILTRLSKLQVLQFGPSFQDALAILGAPLLNQRLSHVRQSSIGIFGERVRMGSGRPPYALSDNFFQLLLLRLPNIQHPALNLPRPLTPYFWSENLPDQLITSLETLELTYTYLNEQDLVHLLRACPRLRTLKYDYWTIPPSRDPYVNGAARYTPDRSSERLVNTQLLGQALELVRETLVCLHLHIVPPMDWFNQYLQRLDFTAFGALTTLHVPLQLLTNKTSSYTLAQSLPRSLKHLWLNDDGACLWFNHQLFWNPRQDYYFEHNVNPVYNPAWHPVHTDQDILDVIFGFLVDCHTHVPNLETLRLIVYSIEWACWPERDDALLRTTLVMAGQRAGVEVSVHKVHERHCVRGRKSIRNIQDPPYFTLHSLHESTWPEMHPQSLDAENEDT